MAAAYFALFFLFDELGCEMFVPTYRKQLHTHADSTNFF